MKKKTVALILALAMVATACVRTSDIDGNRPVSVGAIGAAALTLFDDCDDYLEYARAEALKRVTAYGLEGYGYFGFGGDDVAVLEREESVDESAPTTTAAAQSFDSADAALDGGGDFSESNVQVSGVDEPDLVKTDGDRIFVLANGQLYVLDTAGAVLGSKSLEIWSESMFIYEDTVVVFSSDWSYHEFGPEFGRGYGPGSPITEVVMMDVSDPADIEIVERLRVDGAQVSARLIDSTMRLVVNAAPLGFEWVYPEGSGLRAEGAAEEANRKLIEESTVDNWLPYYIHSGPAGDTQGVLVQCSNAFHPEEFSGFDLLTIVTLDLSQGLLPETSTGLMAGGSTLYATADSIYVAQQRWIDWSEESPDVDGITTDIHAFDSSDDTVVYRASGSVPGFLLNQFAMDEWQGDLRVATTRTPQWFGSGEQSDSVVSVLRADDGELNVIGSVEGLGVTEQIRSVRFLGPLGYVVTFRQTDPLYVVDLSDPTTPEVKGELKINGYSAYLHPYGDGQLVGIGQDATEQGRTLGLQVSLFDVTDSEAPTRTDALSLSNAYTEAEWNHLAVTAWRDRFFVPFQRWGGEEVFIDDSVTDEPFFFDFEVGLLVVEVSDSGIRDLGRIQHPTNYFCWDEETGEVEFGSELADFCEPDYGGQIRRTLIIGDQIFSVSASGIQANDWATLEPGVFTPFD
jgi:hypothetical protein